MIFFCNISDRFVFGSAVFACLLVVFSLYPSGMVLGQEEIASSTDYGETYLIGPGDVLDIQVWREPDLSRTFTVRPDGKITMPLLDDVQAAGLSPMQLKAVIERDLARFIDGPTVSVGVAEINSKFVYVLGKVNTPGQLPLQRGMTVMQALSLAGGFAEWADEKNIVILRERQGKKERIPFNYKDVSMGKNLEANIVLQPGDTIVVP